MHSYWRELYDYLGSEFEPGLMAGKDSTAEREIGAKGLEYWLEKSQTRLYHEVSAAVGSWVTSLLGVIREVVKPPCRILDYGCGIGSAGLWLLDRGLGYEVDFADDAKECLQFLRWRLKQRDVKARVTRLSSAQGDYDAVISLGRLNYLPPKEQMGEIEHIAALGEIAAIGFISVAKVGICPVSTIALRPRFAECNLAVLRWEVRNSVAHLIALKGPPSADEIAPEAEGPGIESMEVNQ